MNKWFCLRVILLAVLFVTGFLQKSSTPWAPPLTWTDLIVILMALIVGMQFIIGMQYINPLSGKVWTKPSWDQNPFNLRQPVGYSIMASGASSLGICFLKSGNLVEPLMLLTMGIGAIVGVRLSMIIFKRKFIADTYNVTQEQ